MKKISLSLLFSFILLFQSVSFSASFLNRIRTVVQPQSSTPALDEATIIKGLKEALRIGTEKAVEIVHKQDGYFANQVIKILLPPSVKNTEKKCRSIGLGSHIDDLILKMNRAAEKAAKKAVPIFINAITSMTLSDAKKILNGEDNAATKYFENRTRTELYNTFHPIIKSALDEVGATKVYKFIIERYNKLPFVKKIQYDLDVWTTNKALDGLFHTLAKEETKIRRNPAFRVTELLRKVFGSIVR